MANQCRLGGRFSRCRNAASHTCQYCGRPFCDAHLCYVHDHEEVCSHPTCRAKHEDVVRHLGYRGRVRERNQVGLCGEESCGPHPTYECSLCRGHFCATHILDRNYPVRHGSVVIERPVSVCGWCWRRRKIWRR